MQKCAWRLPTCRGIYVRSVFQIQQIEIWTRQLTFSRSRGLWEWTQLTDCGPFYISQGKKGTFFFFCLHSFVSPCLVWMWLIRQRTACKLILKPAERPETRSENSIEPGLNIWFHLLAFFLLFHFPVTLWRLSCVPAEALLDGSPAVLKDLLNLIPVCWSFRPQVPRGQPGGEFGVPPPHTPPPSIPSLSPALKHFCSYSSFLLCFLLPHVPWGYTEPPLGGHWTRPGPFSLPNKSSLR